MFESSLPYARFISCAICCVARTLHIYIALVSDEKFSGATGAMALRREYVGLPLRGCFDEATVVLKFHDPAKNDKIVF